MGDLKGMELWWTMLPAMTRVVRQLKKVMRKTSLITVLFLSFAVVGVGWYISSNTMPPLNPGASTNFRASKVLLANDGTKASKVNFTAHRYNAFDTWGPYQFSAYVTEGGNIGLVRMTLSNRGIRRRVFVPPASNRVDVKDAHNVVALAVDNAGYIHLAFGMHNSPLRYYRSTTGGGNINASFSKVVTMTGRDEAHVTYPTFFKVKRVLYFLYRDGKSGRGEAHLNRYNTSSKRWEVVAHPLLVSQKANVSPYWNNVVVDSHTGRVHLSWVYRGNSGPESNYRVCYAYSDNLNTATVPVWRKADGSLIPNPNRADKSQPVIRKRDCDVVDNVPEKQGLSNQNSLALDGLGQPHLVYLKNGTQKKNNRLQIFHAYYNKSMKRWEIHEVTRSSYPPVRPKIVIKGQTGLILSKFSYSGVIGWISHDNFKTRGRVTVLDKRPVTEAQVVINQAKWNYNNTLEFLYPGQKRSDILLVTIKGGLI